MPSVNLQAHTELESGYGRMGHFTRKALEGLGVTSCGDIGNEPSDVELARVALWLSTPPHVRGWYEGQLAAIFTMWESSEIPPGFRENLHHFDRIFVPSVQNMELFGRFHDDVRYVPLGVDEKWVYRGRPPVEREFRFLTAGFGARKGVPQVVEAFKRVFPKGQPLSRLGPVPKLICKSGDDVSGPGITVIQGRLDGPEERELYASAHCFVSGSKGEGWGLMPLQAIVQGCPTILGNAHGHAAYAHYGIPLDTHPFSARGATFWGNGGDWWEPDFEQMCEAMRSVYEEYEVYADDAAINAIPAAAEFTWEQTAQSLILELPEMFEAPPTERVWRSAPPRLFHIRVNKHVKYVINGVTYVFEPGKDYWEAADLKRQIISGGHLDMDSFDPHDLGREDNADDDKLAATRAANAICSTCHQPYNRGQRIEDLVGA